jgi:hypothetical protein
MLKASKEWHLPKIYRYKVGSVSGKPNVWKSPGPSLGWNKYDYSDGSIEDVTGVARIGVALTLGRYAYCIKWADSRLVKVG